MTTSIEEALFQRPDAVVVANPTALHLDVAIPCARAGCAILMEKPISHSFDRIPDCNRHFRQVAEGFSPDFNFDFTPVSFN